MSKWSQADALDLAIDSHDYREIGVRDVLACSRLSDDVAVRDRAILLTALETLAEECADRLSESDEEVEEAEKRASEAEDRLEVYLQGADGETAQKLEEAEADRDSAQAERDELRNAVRGLQYELDRCREKVRTLQAALAVTCAEKACGNEVAPKRARKVKRS